MGNTNVYILKILLRICFVNVMDTTYLDIRSVHGCVLPVEWKEEIDMAASGTICNVGRSRTSESRLVHMQILSRLGKHKNAW